MLVVLQLMELVPQVMLKLEQEISQLQTLAQTVPQIIIKMPLMLLLQSVFLKLQEHACQDTPIRMEPVKTPTQ